MARLTVDAVSAKTLPFLDSLADDNDKLLAVLSQTSGEALERLTLAAVSRNIIPGYQQSFQNQSIAHLLEGLIFTNLKEDDATVRAAITISGEVVQRALLAMSIVRYKYVDGPMLGN